MSDEPDLEPVEFDDLDPGPALRDVRWLTGIIWVALLVALLVTSIYAMNAFTQGTIATR